MLKLETTGTKYTKAPVFIFAGDGRQADHCARYVLKLKTKQEYRIVDHDHRMYGFRNHTLYLYGTWYNRPNSHLILQMAKILNFETIEIEDNR